MSGLGDNMEFDPAVADAVREYLRESLGVSGSAKAAGDGAASTASPAELSASQAVSRDAFQGWLQAVKDAHQQQAA